MGTTATALRTQPGVAIRYVLAIEGYENLITDHATPAAVVTAWAGTGWTSAIPGLRVNASIAQSIRPWQTDLGVQTIRVAVAPLAGDAFGKAVFKTKPTFSTRLTSTFKPAADGSGTINVKSSAGAAASGDVYIGGKRFSYGSKATGQLVVNLGGAGTFSPFGTSSGAKFVGPSTHPSNVNNDVAAPPKVTNVPRGWIGRKVALYVHRIVGSVLDTRAEAQLEFAGRICDILDTEEGDTVLELEDIRACVRDATILQRQWRAFVKPGIRLVAGTRLRASEYTNSSTVRSGEFVVVASGASGADEINAGTYELGEFLSRLDAWTAADATLQGEWSFAVRGASESGSRVEIAARFSSGNSRRIHIDSTSADVFDFLGFDNGGVSADGGSYHPSRGTDWVGFVIWGNGQETLYSTITSGRAPYKVKFIQNKTFGTLSNVAVEIEAPEGTFHDQRPYLPPALRPFTGSTGTWGVLRVGNGIYLGKLDGTTLTGLSQGIYTLRYVDDSADPLNEGLSVDSPEERLAVTQVLLLEGSFSDLMTKLFASVGGTAGVNHPTYDVFPWGAGIPWTLLGDEWLASVRALEEAHNSKSITTLVTEPTKLLDLLMPELAMRFAWLIWKDEGLRLVTLPTPSSLSPDFVLNEATKAEAADSQGSGRITARVTAEHLRNVIKVRYARSATGSYRRTLEVIDAASVDESGGARPYTIDAVNSFGQEAMAGASVEEMVASLVSRVLPVFAKPLRTMKRSLSPNQCHAAPGDTAVVSDNHARDPVTGLRGTTNRSAVILSTSFDRGLHGGKYHGECEVLLVDEDRHFPMAPAAEVDTSYSGAIDGRTFTNGYAAAAAGGPAIKLKANAYSRAADPDDVTHWAPGYKGRLVRLDGAVSGDAWNVSVVAVDRTDGYLVLSADISSPSYTAAAAERYRLQFRERSACTAAQQLHAFQADDGDGLIEDAADPNTYGEKRWQSFSPAALTTLPNLPVAAEFWGDGQPFHAGLVHDIALFNNILPSYRTAPNVTLRRRQPIVGNPAFYMPVLIGCIPIGAPAAAGLVRKLYIAPFFRSSNAANTAKVRVTSSAQMPKAVPSGTSLEFQGPTNSVEFTTTSTTFAEATPQALVPIRSGILTWLTVEIMATNVSYNTITHGLSRCYLGPAEAA